MRPLVLILIAAAVGYQLFFRYEHWPAENGQVHERDNLTGATYTLHPGEKISFADRLLGRVGKRSEALNASGKTEIPAPVAASAVASKEEPEVVSLMAVPVPSRNSAQKATELIDQAFASRQIDLNQDGAPEEIIQSVTARDGLLDISIVKEGKELFYARGNKLTLLPSKSTGWSDLALSLNSGASSYYRYYPNLGGYKLLEGKP